jgi:hypothetical protein
MRNAVCSVLRKISEAALWAYVSLNMVTRIRSLATGLGGGGLGGWNDSPGQQSRRGIKMVGKMTILNKKLFSALKKKFKFLSPI